MAYETPISRRSWLQAFGAAGLAAGTLSAGPTPAVTHRLRLARGKLEAIVVDNHDGLSGAAQERRRRAMPSAAGGLGEMFSTVSFEERFNGYNGLAMLRYDGSVSPFVPAVAGLNCEYIFDEREPDYEPRWKDVDSWEAQNSSLEQISPAAARMRIEPGKRFGVQVETQFELVEPWFVDVEYGFTATDPARMPKTLLGVFWACYMQVPRIPQFFFVGRERAGAPARWLDVVEAFHLETSGVVTSEARGPERSALGSHPLVYGVVETRYAKPFFCGKVHGLLFASLFRPGPQVEVRLSWNAAGGGPGCPAWDYQAVVLRPEPGRRYTLRQRVVYKPFGGLEEAERLYDEWARPA
jgi:hypothetical protein